MKLNINPIVMGQMYYYDISMLYKKYVEYLEEDNKAQKAEQERYEQEYADKYQQPDLNAMMRDAQHSTPNYDSLAKGFNLGNLSSYGL